MKARWVSLLLLSLLWLPNMLSHTSALAVAQPGGAQGQGVDLRRLAFEPLAPDAEADIELPVMEVNVAADGTLRIHHQFRTKARTFKPNYGWHVDLRTMTYRTFRLTQQEDVERFQAYLEAQKRKPPLTPAELARVARRAVWVEPSGQPPLEPLAGTLSALVKARLGPAAMVMPKGPELQDGPCNCCPTCECTGNHEAWAETLDPPNAVLTRTHAKLIWQSTSYQPDQNICWMESWAYPISITECQGISPTSAGTNWYRLACEIRPEDYDHLDRFGYTETRGIYYNNDFPLSLGQNVYADQTVYVYVNGIETGHGAIHAFSGAWTASLLSGRVYGGGYNACVM